MRDELPRPSLAALAVDAAVPSRSQPHRAQTKLCGIASRSIGHLEPLELDLLTAFALYTERSGGGCVVPEGASTDSMSKGVVRARVDRLIHLGVLKRMPSAFGGSLTIASTVLKEYLLAVALLEGQVDASDLTKVDSPMSTYFAEGQPLVPLLRSLSWCNAAAMSVALAGARRAEHLEDALQWPAAMAARALESAASYGLDQQALAERFSAQLGGAPEPVAERAVRVTLLGRAFGGGDQQLLTSVASEGLGAVPVTNSEFCAFVDSGGYDDEAVWCEEGWRWRTGVGGSHDVLSHWDLYLSSVKAQGLDNVRRERGWRAERFQLIAHLCGLSRPELGAAIEMMMSRSVSAPAFWLDSRFNAPMKPVVGVNFYEAEAFCRWQGQVAGRECWLPSLDEWMAGSAGPWSYPWGDEFDPSRANTLEGGLGSTTPVGSYSPDVGGLYDTCGNVWEWTSTTWRCGEVDEPVGMGFDGVEYKVVKGGSWDNRSSYAVLDVFDVDPREMFGTRLGFRVNWGGYA